MLDATEVAERLRAAMDLRETPILSADLARRMGVTKQTVYVWRTKGTVAKHHWEGLCRETEMPYNFFFESARGSTPETKAIWRRLGKLFTKVALLALLVLPFHKPAEAIQHNFLSSRQVLDINTDCILSFMRGMCLVLERFFGQLVTFFTSRTLHNKA